MKMLTIAFEAPASPETMGLIVELSDRGLAVTIQPADAPEEKAQPKKARPTKEVALKEEPAKKRKEVKRPKDRLPPGHTVASVIHQRAQGGAHRKVLEDAIVEMGFSRQSYRPRLSLLLEAGLAHVEGDKVTTFEPELSPIDVARRVRVIEAGKRGRPNPMEA